MDLIAGPHDPPQPRRLDFDFTRPCPPDWMGGSLPYSCLLNAYSIVFPALETIMVRHVGRAARLVPAGTDLAAVRGFLQQEGSHAREHRRSMECISAQGFRVAGTHNLTTLLVRLTDALLHRVLRPVLGHGFAVAIFAAAEHWTASLAETSLRPGPWLASVGRLDRPEPPPDLSEMEVLFLWHVAEELEHKTVVADLLDTIGGTERTRVGGFLLATPVFLLLTGIGFGSMLAQLPRVLGPVEWRRIGRWRGLFRLVRTDLQEIPRTYRATIRSYLRRGFHPADHDTEALVAQAFARLAGVRAEV